MDYLMNLDKDTKIFMIASLILHAEEEKVKWGTT